MSDTFDFPALRKGEEERICIRCGKPFVPNSRTQKYCSPECREGEKPEPRYDKEQSARRKAAIKEVRKMQDNNLMSLNDALFRELDRIENAGPEELETEVSRANMVCNLAGNIVANGRLVLAASQASMTTAETVTVPKMLLGGGC